MDEQHSRRAFMKGAAALPAAGAIGALGMREVVQAAEVATPVSPYTNYPWQWFVSSDGDEYHDVFNTMQEAVEYAKQCQYSIVAECQQQDFDLSISGNTIIEWLDDNNYDTRGDCEGIECTNEQAKDLENMVTAAIEAWVVKHKISITAWTFAGVRNKTNISIS